MPPLLRQKFRASQVVNPVDQDDAQWIAQAKLGQTVPFEALVRKYQDRLFSALVQICGSRQEAEDVTQDVFVQAYRKLSTFAGNSAFYTWLYRIAINASISRRRKKRAEYSVEQTRTVTGDEPIDRSEASDERLLREERAVQVQNALQQLPEEYRTVLILREMEDCDYEAISQILDLPVGTVRSRLHRGRAQLKEILEQILKDKKD